MSDDGSIIVMADSSVWLAEDVDQVDSQLWLPVDDIIYLADTRGRCVNARSIILLNVDESNETVCAKRVR